MEARDPRTRSAPIQRDAFSRYPPAGEGVDIVVRYVTRAAVRLERVIVCSKQ